MRTITIGTTAAATYAYDYQGRRTSKATSGTTKYLYDGLNLVGEGASLPVLTNEYLFGPGIDEPLAMKASGGAIYYYDVDALGSVTVVNNASGTAFSNYDYDAWGVTLSETETVAQPFRYTGREAGEDGHLFYRARYYRGAVGRFLSEDPLRWMAGVNHYGYALANPIQLVDPMGLDAAHVCCDGKGGFTLCWSNQPSAPFAGCIEEHEKDHIDYLSRNPGNCKGQCRDSSGKPRPAGEHTWQMTPAEHDEMECRGYAAEASCLRKAMGQASDKSAVLRRINQLIHLAKGFGNFKCNTSAW
jgi:RHS repeat-associated protein